MSGKPLARITPETELLRGRTIVVTGAASGFGRCIAYIAAYQGANVAITDFNEAAGNETADAIKKDFPSSNVSFFACDITNEAAWDSFIADALSKHKALHGVAHCAGIFTGGDEIHEQSLAVFEREIKVNTVGTYIVNKAMVKVFVDQNKAGVPLPEGGYSIVNLGSKASTAGSNKASAYVASKHAVLGISRCIAFEQAKNHIRCNCLCPGPVNTPLMMRGMQLPLDAPMDVINAKLNELGILDSLLLKQLGDPEDIAHQAVRLLGPRGKFETYTAPAIDGGWI